MAAHQVSTHAAGSSCAYLRRLRGRLGANVSAASRALALVLVPVFAGWWMVEFTRFPEVIRLSTHNLGALMLALVVGWFLTALLFRRRIVIYNNENSALRAASIETEKRAENFQREFAGAEQNFQFLFERSSEGYLLVDDTRIVDCNRSAVVMLRAPGKEQIIGRALKDFAPPSDADAESASAFLNRCYDLRHEQGSYRSDCLYSRMDGAELHVDVSFAALPVRGKTLTLVAWRDLTERREAEEALLRSAARLRVAQAIAHLGHWEYDPRTDRVIWSEEALRILGFGSPTESPTLQSCFHRIHPEDRASAELAFAAAIRKGKPVEIYFRILLPDGNVRYVDSRSRTDLNLAGKAIRVSGTILDITGQKQVEAQLRQTLSEKELLVKEVHHRVKNNLQVISSLLSMQIDLLEDEDSIQALRESQHRISSMALIHERLYSDGNIDNVDFAEYTETLVQELFHAYGKQAQHISKVLDLAPVPLNIEKAIPCGLILNELVTNALKHAFPSGRGTLNVSLKTQSPERLSLCVSDTGIGLPEDLDLKDSKSLGLPLVEVLARQLGGVLDVQSKPGATFTIDFPRSGVI